MSHRWQVIWCVVVIGVLALSVGMAAAALAVHVNHAIKARVAP